MPKRKRSKFTSKKGTNKKKKQINNNQKCETILEKLLAISTNQIDTTNPDDIIDNTSVMEVEECLDLQALQTNTLSVVRGNYHQGNIRYSFISRQKQCTANAVAAIAFSYIKSVLNWDPAAIDHILDFGDGLYKKSLLTRTIPQANYDLDVMYLNVIEVYNKFIIENTAFKLTLDENQEIYGVTVNNNESFGLSLRDGLETLFFSHNACVFTANSLSTALFKIDTTYFLFDSHSRDENGKSVSETEGRACLIKFYTIDRLHDFLIESFGDNSVYSLFPPQIEIEQVQQRHHQNGYEMLHLIEYPVELNNSMEILTINSAAYTTSVNSIKNPSAKIGQPEPDLIDLGRMSVECPFCQALFFQSEPKTCCSAGKIKLIQNTIYPQLLKALLTDCHPQSKSFITNIRKYNTLLAFGSTQATLRNDIGHGAPVIVVSGQIHHKIGNIDLNEPKFGSLYYLDAGEASSRREQNNVNTGCNQQLLIQIDNLLRQINPFARLYRSLGNVVDEHERNNQNVERIGLYFHVRPNTNRRIQAAPSNANEIGAVFESQAGDFPVPGQIRVYLRDTGLINIPKLSPIVDGLCYPIMFPNGELGWDNNLQRQNVAQRARISKREFDNYRIMVRSNTFNPIINCGRLTQQYIVDKYVELEGDRLNFNRQNQKSLRADDYVGLQDYLKKRNEGIAAARIGRAVILPSTFTCGPRFMQQNYQDAMTIVAKYGKPTFFITFTCNPQWSEIKNHLGPNQNPQDRPELISRVFEQKRKILMKDIVDRQIFGKILAFVDVIEFQKRGLPHMHLIIIASDEYKIRDPDDVDSFICAELPESNTKLHEIVTACMVHGPCGDRNPNSPCMINDQCSKRYPMRFIQHTKIDGQRPEYRRRNDGRSTQIIRGNRVFTIDNRDIVPYNPYLLLKYGSHINIEYCSNVKAIKYLFKYIYKGPDSAVVQLHDELIHDEIQDFIDSRYISSGEAAWRLLKFSVHTQSHTIVRLPVHLPGERTVYFEENAEEQAIQNNENKCSMLEAFFKLNDEDVRARQYLYSEIPLYYRFDKKHHRWNLRIRHMKIISRMYVISPKYVEKFHLRIILLHVRGPKSFNDLLTVNGETFDTFQQAARARLLITSDEEWDRTLQDASLLQMPNQMRKLFAHLLCFCTVGNPHFLWEKYKSFMIEDFTKKGYSSEDSETYSLRIIDKILCNLGQALRFFDLPQINIDGPIPDLNETPTFVNENVNSHLSYHPDRLNQDQRIIFNITVNAALNENIQQRYFYLQGSGGTGKTFLYNSILAHLNSMNINTLAVAFTGIAALLLTNGKTAHSAFRLPLNLNSESQSTIKTQSEQATLLRNLRLIIWDEISMTNFHAIDVVDRLLRDICVNDRPFGGKCVLFGGDVKQLLPVAPGQVRQTELFFTNCSAWSHFQILELRINMRTDPDEVEFAEWLLDIGKGVPNSIETEIRLPNECLSDNLITDIFGQVTEIDPESTRELAGKAILCTRNNDCNEFNNEILQDFPGTISTIFSVDSILTDDNEEITNYPEEFLNSITPSGLPLHKLQLKVGVPVILLRNLSITDGLINGTRLIVLAITEFILTTEIVTGVFAGQRALIPRIDLTSTDPNFPFTLQRRQFPVKLCFALTINKAQGQTFDKVGIYLGNPVFSHGQLYVAISRVRNLRSLKIQIKKRALLLHHCQSQKILSIQIF